MGDAPIANPGDDGGQVFFPDAATSEGGSGSCIPKTCQSLGANCGPQGDGCGGMLQCGTCTAPQTCGGGGTASQCGGNSGCVPKTCQDLGATCGAQGDGCGGTIASCGTCTAPDICGGGGKASVCGGGGGGNDAGTCIPTKTTCAPGDCGPVSDGCGGLLQCGGCTAPQICGGGGTPSKCGGGTLQDGGQVCVPKTCAQLGANCGPMGDGCGGLIASCGTCSNGQVCGATTASQCGGGSDAGTCTGLCTQIPTCQNNTTTTLTGTVVAPRTCVNQTCSAQTGLCTGTCNSLANPADADPISGATVFVLNGSLSTFPSTVSCDQCGGAGSQSGALVTAITGPDGKFTLSGMPVGQNIPVVVQLGRWRRVFNVNVTNSCGPNSVGDLHLPKNHNEGNIPLMALSTGQVDTLECLLRKIGIDDAEFTLPSDAGRVRLYQGNGAGAIAAPGGSTGNLPAESTLTAAKATLDNYDMVLFPCWGGEVRKAQADQQNLIDYTHDGGRVFATHYSYVWLFGLNPQAPGDTPPGWGSEFRPTATWSNGGLADQSFPQPDPLASIVDNTFTKGAAFAQWLSLVGNGANAGVNALFQQINPGPPEVLINSPRNDVDTVAATSQRWMYASSNGTDSCTSCANPTTSQNPNLSNFVEHYTFNTPVGGTPTSQCGRVVFSDFHVTGGASQGTFPTECGGSKGNGYNHNATLSPQEKVLEYMLFDLASCITPDKPPPPPTCTPKTCPQLGISCGPAGDGCGGLIASCGTCAGNQTCGGGGVPGQCGGPTCTPQSCASLGYNCGLAGDGCGGTLNCGSCQSGQNCGGGGSSNVCGTPTCTPKTCSSLNVQCGSVGDGCGNLLQCGSCPTGQTCGGGGTPGKCGAPPCTPVTCAQLNANCGPVGDGCGGILQCGDCTSPQTCGGGGVANQCGGGIR